MSGFKFHTEPLREEWLDDYGHLNEAFYLVPFSATSWRLQDHFGIGVAYFKRTGGAIYTVESHLRYLQEVRAPATLEIETVVLGSDAKRLWFAHSMLVDGSVRATFECLTIHFDANAGRTSPLPDDVQAALKAAETDARPAWAGRGISLSRR